VNIINWSVSSICWYLIYWCIHRILLIDNYYLITNKLLFADWQIIIIDWNVIYIINELKHKILFVHQRIIIIDWNIVYIIDGLKHKILFVDWNTTHIINGLINNNYQLKYILYC
jgi:hypothetical protein